MMRINELIAQAYEKGSVKGTSEQKVVSIIEKCKELES